MKKALEGLVVLDFTRYIAGPYAAYLLGHLGAYVIKVEKATVAELIGDRSAQLSTAVYVNNTPQAMTRATTNGFSAYGAKYVDEMGTIHPAVIHLTDLNGYDKAYHNETDKPAMTRAAVNNGHYKYYTAEDLAGGRTRASMHVNVLSIHDKLSFKHKFEMQGVPTDTITVSGEVPIDYDLNYFMTLEGGVKWSGWLPELYLKKFETGLDGDFAFSPEAYLSFGVSANLKDEMKRLTLATFGSYTFTFVVGVVPVCIVVNPALYMNFNASAEGNVRVGFKYDYANRFKAGEQYAEYLKVKNLLEIGEMIRSNSAFQYYANSVSDWGECIDFLEIGTEFENIYHRQPKQTNDDVKTMLELTIAAGKIFYEQNKSQWQQVYTYMMTNVYHHNEWYPKFCKQRAAYDTMMIWSRAYGKNVIGRENWDNMVMDFNAHINDIYQISRSGIEIK